MADHRFNTPEPVELAISIPAGDIEVETVDGEETTVVVEGHEKLVAETIVQQNGERISVELRRKLGFGITLSVGDFSIGGPQLIVKARVPHGSRPVLNTASADMELRGRFASLMSKSASGDLKVEGEIEGDANVKTVSGDVRLPRVGGELVLQSVSGDLTVTSVAGSSRVKSVSGDVRIDSTHEGEVTVQSVSGDISLGVAPGTNVDVDAGSVSGDLSSEVALGSDIGQGIGDGPTLVVRGKTVSGDFKLFRAA
jgi:Putative adhesin